MRSKYFYFFWTCILVWAIVAAAAVAHRLSDRPQRIWDQNGIPAGETHFG